MFNFIANTNVEIGNGKFSKFINEFDKNYNGQTLFILDEGFAKSEIWLKQKNKLQFSNSNISFLFFKGKNEPSYDDLEEILLEAKKYMPDTIVGIGGGSCMDIAKAVACLLVNQGPSINYRGFDKLKLPGVHTILIPTTAGTGSESSYNASFVDIKSKRKMGINGKFMFASKAILDAETLCSCPKDALLGSATDALTHALEGFICNNSNEFSDTLSKKAFQYSINNFNCILDIRNNLDAGLNLMKAAYLGGIIQMNSGSGIAAAISYPLSVYYKVPHGIGGGIFLLGIMKYNIDNGIKKYEELIPYVKDKTLGNSRDLYSYMQNLFNKLGVPKNLGKYGITKKDKKELCKIMQTQQIAFDQNPIKFSTNYDFENFIDNYLE